MRLLLLSISLLFLTSCTSTDTAMLSENTAIISARGNGFSSSAGVFRDTVVEAANLTLASGYSHFAILNNQDRTRTGYLVIPGQTSTYGSAHTTMNRFGNSGYGTTSFSAHTYSSPGSVTNIIKPGMDITIRMFRADEIDMKAPGIWDAQGVLNAQPKE